jgi:hypothetical protein
MRFSAGPPASPGSAIPDTSPFTSATRTGTPAADSCSLMSCSVRVLPVPVAPATSPWRFRVASGHAHDGRRVDRSRVHAAAEIEARAGRAVGVGDRGGEVGHGRES